MTETNVVLTIIGLVLSLISILAIYYGPITAVRTQRVLDDEREDKKRDRQRKEEIFRAIWVTRSIPYNIRHVEALILIDLDFVNVPTVIAAWNLYHDHLMIRPQPANWEDRRVELLTDLLYELGVALGYNYDRVLLMRHWYRPQLHGTMDEQDWVLRTGLTAIMKGEAALKVKLVEEPPPPTPASTSPPTPRTS